MILEISVYSELGPLLYWSMVRQNIMAGKEIETKWLVSYTTGDTQGLCREGTGTRYNLPGYTLNSPLLSNNLSHYEFIKRLIH